jgi:anti-anti-sigma regulatory factor
MPTVYTSERVVNDLTILRLYGDLAASPEDTELEAFKSVLTDLLTRGRLVIAINLAGAKVVDAEGLGELVAGFKRVKNLGGRLALIAPAERVILVVGDRKALEPNLRVLGYTKIKAVSHDGVPATD